MKNRPRIDDQHLVMAELGPVIPALLREAVDHGFHNYKVSRKLDPIGFTVYRDTCRANMMYDQITACARDLVDSLADPARTRYTITSNKRSTEIEHDPFFVCRFKRTKKKRAHRSTSVSTDRQVIIKTPTDWAGQLVLPYPDRPDWIDPMERIWLTVGFDLNDLEEELSKVSIGVETMRGFLWKLSIPVADADVLGRMPAALADRIGDLRNQRLA